jgi:ferredoxin-type protein NapH
MKRQQVRKIMLLFSFLLFPVTIWYFSPYLIIMGASQGVVTGSFIVFILLFAGSLFFGRWFCGWICPAAGLQEACTMIHSKPVKTGNWIKYLIWVPWIILIGFVALQAGGLKTIDPFYQTDHGISVTQPQSYIFFYIVVGLITILALTAGKRAFCHHICWMAPFMIIGTKIQNLFRWPALHLRVEPNLCLHCKKCSRECPMSLDVEQMVRKGIIGNSECILCGNCADACPKSVIHYTWQAGK